MNFKSTEEELGLKRQCLKKAPDTASSHASLSLTMKMAVRRKRTPPTTSTPELEKNEYWRERYISQEWSQDVLFTVITTSSVTFSCSSIIFMELMRAASVELASAMSCTMFPQEAAPLTIMVKRPSDISPMR